MHRNIKMVALLGLLVAFGTTTAAAEVQWAKPPYQDIVKRAKQENKYVFIDFYATWCGPCKRLDEVTYQDPKVEAFLSGLVSVKYDAEKGEGETLAKRFKVSAYPTLVVLGPDGKEIDRQVGYLDPEPFLEVIEGYTKGIGTVAFYEKELEENPDDIEVLYTLGTKHADAGRAGKAQELLGRVLQLDPGDEHEYAAPAFYSLGSVTYDNEDYKASRGYFEKLVERFPDTDWYDRGLSRLARVHYRLDERDKSIAAYKKLVERHPDDPGTLNGFAWFCAQRRFGFDEALPVALKAVEVSDRDPGILDTLAELYYAMGDYDNAIKIGEEAASKEPDDTYFKDQVKKFRDAAAKAKEAAGDHARS